MKRIAIALCVGLLVSYSAYSQDCDPVWFGNDGIFGVCYDDAWGTDGLDNSGQVVLEHPDMPGGAIFLTLPLPFEKLNLQDYTSARAGLLMGTFTSAGAGKGRVVDSAVDEIDGNPGQMIQFVNEKDGQATIAGLMVGIDYSGLYATMCITAPAPAMDEFMKVAGPIIGSFKVDLEAAANDKDNLIATGQLWEEQILTILGR